MMTFRNLVRCAAAVTTLLLVNCANQKPTAQVNKDGTIVNPFPAGTYEHFKAEPKYPKTHDVWKNEELLSRTNSENSHIKINLATQRGMLMNGEEVALDYPICSGTKSRPTPTGTFYILEKVVDKRSNRYGKFLDAAGEVVNSNADAVLDPMPEGGSFQGAEMRHWMRLTNDGVGHHIGPVRRVPSSHACVRGPSKTIPIVYSKVKTGTRVDIE
ncbi:MAG: L,D-transpeptidase [Gloeobacteraceae cyanobacterium ES-bin-144]|nr:L,D-transpeptidase [Verrucomicrobiales bacterium]